MRGSRPLCDLIFSTDILVLRPCSPWRRHAIEGPHVPTMKVGVRGVCMPARIDDEVAESIYRLAGAEPNGPYPGNDKAWKGVCKACGEPVSPTLKALKRGQGPCKPCGAKAGGSKLRIPIEIAEEILVQANAVPTAPYPGRQELPWPAICQLCGKEITPRVKDVKKGHRACKYCAAKASAVARQTDPRFAYDMYLAAGGIPDSPYPGRQDLRWSGHCQAMGHEIWPRLSSLLRGSWACITCVNENRRPRTPSDLAIAEYRKRGGEPTVEFPGVTKPWAGTCRRCGADVRPRLKHIVRTDVSVCPFCNNRNRIKKRFLSQQEAERIYREAGGVPDPNTQYVHSKVPWVGKCATCGSRIAPRLNNLQNGSGACTRCAPLGFTLDAESVIYLVRNRTDKIKIGIANLSAFEVRLRSHARNWNGTELIDCISGIGWDVRDLERDVKGLLDLAGVDRGKAAWESFDGYYETWRRTDLDPSSIDELVACLRERASNRAV